MNMALRLLLLLSLGGTAMGLVLMLLRKWLGNRLPSAVYYYAWLLVLVRLLLPLPGLVPMGAEEPVAAPAPVVATTTAEEWSAADRVWMAEREQTGVMETGMTVYEVSAPEEEPVSEENAVSAVTAETEKVSAPQTAAKAAALCKRCLAAIKAVLSRPGFWMGLWALGTAFCVGGCLVGYLRFFRALKETFRPANESDTKVYESIYEGVKPTLVCSCCVKTPMLMGLLKPVLILPNRVYAPRMLESILRHELTHHHRGDLLYKWFAAAVFALHWFNPFMGLFRRELDCLCELSCDEFILREMTQEEKQNYGETLLSLAAIRSLPRSVVATTFATEKRTLKERLEQIMTYKHGGKKTLALALVVLLLFSGCGVAMGPEAAKVSEPQIDILSAELPPMAPGEEASGEPEVVQMDAPAGGETVTVSTVDEFLAAIAPNNTIILEPGEYILSDAETYGKTLEGGWYTWDNSYGDGYQLNIHDVDGLVIQGGGEATICTEPRGVEVLAFVGCSDIEISGTVVGHTVMPAMCMGGVLYFDSCDDALVTNCGLYGCGTWGITAVNSRNIRAVDTDIYDCSYGAVQATSCYDIRLENCAIYDCALDFNSMELLRFKYCYGVALVNCEVYNNCNQVFLGSEYSEEVYLLGTRVEDNTFQQSLVFAYPYSPVVDGCLFADNGEAPANGVPIWASNYTGVPAVSPDGEELSRADFESMTLESRTYGGPAAVETVAVEKTLSESGRTEVWVTNVDEFLAAIGPNTIIHMAEGDYDLSEAAHYGSYGGQYYWWAGYGDGPGLVIGGVENMQIIGEGKDVVELLAVPRYVEVITFSDCSHVLVSGITAGHTPINESTCVGGVVKLQNCGTMSLQECGLFGCGTWGVTAENSSDIVVLNTEIYDCSVGAVQIRNSTNVALDNCDMHDCANNNRILTTGSVNVTVNGEVI